ncbi:MAG: hypothetical protein IJJ11_04320 [Methanosphaera sp.]|nr:hypothetical protein [Methanosphaera sp.]
MKDNNENRKKITIEEILNIYKRVKIIDEPQCPFPQVDNFNNFVNFCLSIKNNMSIEELKIKHNLKPRHFNFYISAGRYLYILDSGTELTVLGEVLFNLDERTRNLIIVELILSHKPFHDIFYRFIVSSHVPSSDEIYEIIKDMKLYHINSEVTLRRRAQSARQWIVWIVSLCEF